METATQNGGSQDPEKYEGMKLTLCWAVGHPPKGDPAIEGWRRKF